MLRDERNGASEHSEARLEPHKVTAKILLAAARIKSLENEPDAKRLTDRNTEQKKDESFPSLRLWPNAK